MIVFQRHHDSKLNENKPGNSHRFDVKVASTRTMKAQNAKLRIRLGMDFGGLESVCPVTMARSYHKLSMREKMSST